MASVDEAVGALDVEEHELVAGGGDRGGHAAQALDTEDWVKKGAMTPIVRVRPVERARAAAFGA